jgi:hypothetical protein
MISDLWSYESEVFALLHILHIGIYPSLKYDLSILVLFVFQLTLDTKRRNVMG